MNTKTSLILTAAALSMALLTACNQANDAGAGAGAPAGDTAATNASAAAGMNADGMNPGGAAPADPNMAGGAMNEGQALGMVMAVNEAEIKMAEQARSKKVKGPALEYANMMHTEHTRNLEQTRALEGSAGVRIDDGGQVAEMREKHRAMMDQLGGLDGDAYERAYVDAMVQSHTEALNMLEQRLIPAATQDAVKQHLSMTRDAVAKHLERARELQGQMGGPGATTNEAGAQAGQGEQTSPTR
jgi:putative membrane protein